MFISPLVHAYLFIVIIYFNNAMFKIDFICRSFNVNGKVCRLIILLCDNILSFAEEQFLLAAAGLISCARAGWNGSNKEVNNVLSTEGQVVCSGEKTKFL